MKEFSSISMTEACDCENGVPRHSGCHPTTCRKCGFVIED
jgi:hypothetical protein